MLRTPMPDAEDIKLRYGLAREDIAGPEELIEVPGLGGYEDLLASGVVITGGTALLPGIAEVAEDVLLKQARVAMPIYHGSLADMMRNPRFSTAMGLLCQARQEHGQGRRVAQKQGRFKDIVAKAKEWFMN